MQPRLAVLIDAENVTAKHWPVIRKLMEAKGSIVCCRIFGDFSGGQHGKWLKIAQEQALQTVMQLSGPNACDISMTIAAMDLLHTSKLEGFCLVSSDADFTPLAQRLRSAGLKVFGFGKSAAPASLRNACTEYASFDLPATVAVPKAA
jgi:hypothetical protein